MNLYFAPMEGIALCLYRAAQAELFPGADEYFAPFVSTTTSERVSAREMRDILPENNPGVPLVPQILARRADAFFSTAQRMESLGYREINLNLGCPSRTVVSKGRGAGFLAEPDELGLFFDGVFARDPGFAVSVKTRIGVSSAEELPRIMDVFTRYPIARLIVHPRLQTDYYKNTPDPDAFRYVLSRAKCPVIYNGDVMSKTDFDRVCRLFPGITGVMIGRGALRDPAIFRRLRGGPGIRAEEAFAFASRLTADYRAAYGSEKIVVMKMKEVWIHMIDLFSASSRGMKRVLKAGNLRELDAATEALRLEASLRADEVIRIDPEWEGRT